MASEPGRVVRFDRTERTLHWVHAGAFFAMLATGLVLYLPMLARIISDRPLMKAAHLAVAALWLTALALIAVLGNRRTLGRTRRDLERLDDDDVRWLQRRTPALPGRFNAGQKIHAAVQAALAVLFVVSGALLWLGERNTALRLPGTIALHDVAMYASVILVAGHVYLSLSSHNAGAMEGIVGGTVSEAYAAHHHPRWAPDSSPPPAPAPARRGAARVAVAVIVAVLGLAGARALVDDVVNARHHAGSSVTSPAAVRAAERAIARINAH